ncbi:MAG: bifunctional 4-hydroxy-3-methylbut-2-enyl diphosphate reductase/30S ribosomal protein S1 [Clostridia bacterium]|nr:bifunctional 4-hydroxy-3-methylbut-2-enyl diphosphate reductase/30S ribosomal protein S1 [Clostridia bacterium]
MTVTVAENAGFCFGVKRATDTLEKLIESAAPGTHIYTVGELIHNADYNRELWDKGVRTIDADDISCLESILAADGICKVLIRTHGITLDREEAVRKLSEKYPGQLEIIDCTCPFVKKIHNIADRESGKETLFLLLGAETHPEVEGIASHVNGEVLIFDSAEEAERQVEALGNGKYSFERVVLAAQTTQNLSEWKKTQEIIKKVYTNALIFDTICSVTEKRQLEVEKMAEENDVMVVIGGRSSSNTAKLYDICRKRCGKAYLIQNADELINIKILPAERVGIAAGASTPDRIIQEVRKKMSAEIMTENFEELLESSLKTLNTGDTVVGTVIGITTNEVQLDLGTKVTGTIAFDQITDDPTAKLEDMFKIGDEIEAFVIRVSDVEGIAALSKKRIDSHKNWDKIVAAHESGEILEGRVIEAVRGGVIISLFSNSVFVPASHTGIKADGDLTILVGTTQRVKIIEIKADRRRAYASIRVVLREERRAAEEKIWSDIEEGKVYNGVVKSLTSYGAFVDIGGVDGMVHNTELSWKRIKNPSEVVKVGDNIVVFVKAIDKERKRISLGYKKDEDNPWFIFNQKYQEGDVAEVKIVSFTPFGAFAEIVDGVDGLIHISQITDHKIGNPAEVLEIGATVEAKITGIDHDRCKVNLSIRALMEPAAEEAASAVVEDADVPVYSSDAPEASKYVTEDAE